jgi:hypothetical protein
MSFVEKLETITKIRPSPGMRSHCARLILNGNTVHLGKSSPIRSVL